MERSLGSARRAFASFACALLVGGAVSAVAGVSTVAATVATAGSAAAVPLPSSVTDYAPNVKWGGRTVAVTVNPSDPNTAFAAAESGGLFKTTDNGVHWSHVDSFPQFRMVDVEYAPNNASVLVALSFPDTHTVNQGGVWRSTDGGASWSRPASQSTPCNLAGRGNTRAVAFQAGSNNAYVGTDCGILRSTDLGGTWSAVSLGGQVESLVAQQGGTGGIVDTCGSDGHRRSTDGGQTFSSPPDLIGGGGCPFGQQALAASPLESGVLFAGFANGSVFESDDSGVTWNALNGPTGSSRPPFVAVNRSATAANSIDVFYSNGLNAYHQTCGNTGGPGLRCSNVTASWTAVTAPHTDLSGFAFSTAHTGALTDNCPVYLVGDGGVMQTTDCGNSFNIVGANGNGYNALQVYEATGQIHPDHTDLYFGTQDNDIWGSGDNGATWPGNIRFEGFFLEIPRTSPNDSGQTITGVACSGCSNFKSNAHLASGYNAWNNPPGGGGNPFLVSPGTYVQFSQNPAPNTSMFRTTDTGTTWTRVTLSGPAALVSGGDFSVGLSGRPYIVGPPGDPTLFQAVGEPGNVIGMVKITGFLGATATVTDVTSNISSVEGFRNNTPSYCDGQGSFICPTVFGIDKVNPLRAIVADADAGNMKQTFDGGNTWVVDNQLTNLVTGNGAFQFGQTVHTVAFDPADDRVILVGTEANGIIASFDGGSTWSKMIGSDSIPAISSFFFDEVQHDIIVSSYGRGLWKLAVPTGDLSVTKTHSPEPVIAGNQLTYTLTVKNNGPDGAPNATVTDTLPPQATYLTNNLNPPAGCSAVGQIVTCSVGDLASGQSVTFNIVTLIDPNTVANAGGPTSITNTASVSSSGVLDSNSSNNTAVDTAIVNDSADLQAAKVCKPDTTVYAGTPIDCQVFVDNHGPSNARNVIVEDTMTSSGSFTITNVAVSPGSTVCTTSNVTGGQKISCNTGNLAAASTSQTGRVTLSYRVTATEGQDIGNIANTHSDTPDPNNTNNTVQLNLTVTSLADLALSKSGPATVTAGTPISWTMSVHNNGPSTANNIAITDTVPAGVSITSVAMPGASCAAGVPGDSTRPTVCTFGSLAAAATSSTMTINATVNPRTTGILHNDARVASNTFDNNSTNDLAHSDTTVNVVSSLSVTKVASAPSVTAGTPLSYQITVANGGPSTATSVTLSDPLPGALTFSSTGGVGACGYQSNTNTVTCQLPNLDPGQNEVVFIYTTVKSSTPPGSLTNTATSTADGSPNASGSVTTQVTTSADLGIVLSSDKDVYKPSTDVHYTVTVTNAGPSDAQAVVARVQLPPVKSGYYVSNNGGCTVSGTMVTCNLGTIVSGAIKTVQVNWHAQGNKGLITSTATVTSGTTDPNTANNSSTRNVTVK